MQPDGRAGLVSEHELRTAEPQVGPHEGPEVAPLARQAKAETARCAVCARVSKHLLGRPKYPTDGRQMMVVGELSRIICIMRPHGCQPIW